MTEISCAEVEHSATEYALGILAADEARAVSAHLLGCPPCRSEIEEIRQIGDQLLELVPATEPPLGFDRRVLSATANLGRRRRPRIGLIITAAAAAAVISVAGIVGGFSRTHHPYLATDLAGQFRQGNHKVGTVSVSGNPSWVTMTVRHLSVSELVSCQLVASDGIVSTVGTFELIKGGGSWAAPDPVEGARLVAAMLVGPGGKLLAVAPLKGS